MHLMRLGEPCTAGFLSSGLRLSSTQCLRRVSAACQTMHGLGLSLSPVRKKIRGKVYERARSRPGRALLRGWPYMLATAMFLPCLLHSSQCSQAADGRRLTGRAVYLLHLPNEAIRQYAIRNLRIRTVTIPSIAGLGMGRNRHHYMGR